MKRKIALTIVLMFTVAVMALMRSDSSTKAEPPQKLRFDTGVVAFGPNQVLRLDVTFDREIDPPALVGFRRFDYVQTSCNGGVCKQIISSQTTSAPITLMPNEAISMDITPMAGSSGVRVVLVSSSRNVRVTAAIRNTITGETTSHIIVANASPWGDN